MPGLTSRLAGYPSIRCTGTLVQTNEWGLPVAGLHIECVDTFFVYVEFLAELIYSLSVFGGVVAELPHGALFDR